MYKTRKRAVLISINVLTILCFIGACLLLLPQKTTEGFSWITLLVAFIVFFATVFWGNRFRSFLMAKVRKDTLETGETVILNDFINRLRFCYSLDDFYVVIGNILEKQGDCSVLLIDRTKNYILYNSPNRITSSDAIREKMCQNFEENWKDGYYYFDRHFGVTSRLKKSRGFFLCSEKQHMFVFGKRPQIRLLCQNILQMYHSAYSNLYTLLFIHLIRQLSSQQTGCKEPYI